MKTIDITVDGIEHKAIESAYFDMTIQEFLDINSDHKEESKLLDYLQNKYQGVGLPREYLAEELLITEDSTEYKTAIKYVGGIMGKRKIPDFIPFAVVADLITLEKGSNNEEI